MYTGLYPAVGRGRRHRLGQPLCKASLVRTECIVESHDDMTRLAGTLFVCVFLPKVRPVSVLMPSAASTLAAGAAGGKARRRRKGGSGGPPRLNQIFTPRVHNVPVRVVGVECWRVGWVGWRARCALALQKHNHHSEVFNGNSNENGYPEGFRSVVVIAKSRRVARRNEKSS